MRNIEIIVHQFAEFCKHYLQLKTLPKIELIKDSNWAEEHGTFGMYHPGKDVFQLVVANRHIMDVLRTCGHELVHHKQREEDVDRASRDIIERQANKLGSMLIKVFGRKYPHFFRG